LLIGGLAGAFVVSGWGLVLWAIGTGLGLQLLFMGVLGEYLGKLFMAHSGLPPYAEKKQRL
jgi:undecaprenyl-phosphate 4-deoxy-4-formamido-L-arabinose transferase